MYCISFSLLLYCPHSKHTHTLSILYSIFYCLERKEQFCQRNCHSLSPSVFPASSLYNYFSLSSIFLYNVRSSFYTVSYIKSYVSIFEDSSCFASQPIRVSNFILCFPQCFSPMLFKAELYFCAVLWTILFVHQHIFSVSFSVSFSPPHSGWVHRLVGGLEGVPCSGRWTCPGEMCLVLQLHPHQLHHGHQCQAAPHLVQEQRRCRSKFTDGYYLIQHLYKVKAHKSQYSKTSKSPNIP